MELRVAVPEDKVTAGVLNPALETVTRTNEKLIASGEVPPFDKALAAGLKWHPEPAGQPESFDHAGIVMAGPRWNTGHKFSADCDDLAPYAAASMRASGEDPGAKAIVKKSGPNLWHAVVKRSDGTIRDPSKEAGMVSGVGGAFDGIAPAVVPCMFPPCVNGGAPRPALAIRRVVTARGNVGFDARCDIPIEGTELKISATERSRTASQAIVGAIRGAYLVGKLSETADPEHLKRLVAICGIIGGDDPKEVLRVCGEAACVGALPFVGSLSDSSGDHSVGFNFGKFMKVFEPLASMAVSFVPGVGPILSKGMDIATSVLTAKNPAAAASSLLQSGLNMVSPTPLTADVTAVLNQVPGAAPPGQQWRVFPNGQMTFDIAISGGEEHASGQAWGHHETPAEHAYMAPHKHHHKHGPHPAHDEHHGARE